MLANDPEVAQVARLLALRVLRERRVSPVCAQHFRLIRASSWAQAFEVRLVRAFVKEALGDWRAGRLPAAIVQAVLEISPMLTPEAFGQLCEGLGEQLAVERRQAQPPPVYGFLLWAMGSQTDTLSPAHRQHLARAVTRVGL
jgi:hypothetical protein